MCGIGCVMSLNLRPVPSLEAALGGLDELLAHRGPDGAASWRHDRGHVGFAHRRLSIIGLESGNQPMRGRDGNWIAHNGEIYNYLELREELDASTFRTDSDTEVILRAYERWGPDCLHHLRGMFAFTLWDEREKTLFVARDRFGIKPLYYTVVDGVLYCASEAKALLPFVPRIETDTEALNDYLTFQFTFDDKTMFRDIQQLPPAHTLTVRNGVLAIRRYWEVEYEPDLDHTERYFIDQLRELIANSVSFHTRADVEVGAYLSGGLDSSIICATASRAGSGRRLQAFTGRFDGGAAYDESRYARALADVEEIDLHEIEITSDQFEKHISDVVFALDYPVAGPGAFPQYMVSQLAAKHVKVVLGGQGGDEVFGGYARYLLAYFEQCIRAAIDGTMDRAEFVVTYESIIPNLSTLREYKPLMSSFWEEGLFGDLDERYFRLINRAPSLAGIIDWESIGEDSSLDRFLELFRANNVGPTSYFDRMTHFDFKTLLPALLQVEDRVSMAHGLEARTPFVDHEIIEFAARLPAIVKFKNGELKHALKLATTGLLPPAISGRKDKMGFPVPLVEWLKGPLREFFLDLAASSAQRDYLRADANLTGLLDTEAGFGRNAWALLSLELWHQSFHDAPHRWDELRRRVAAPAAGAHADRPSAIST
jgi:asparagine synthase (glutamine-hydrolysing)